MPSNEVVREAQQLVRGGGQVLIFSHTRRGEQACLDLATICTDEKDLIGSYSAGFTLQAEVARLDRSRVESAPVVLDLDDHAGRVRLDPDLGGAGASVLDDVRERLAADSVELRLGRPGERHALLRAVHVDPQLGVLREARDMPGESGDETCLDPVGPPLEDELPHLGLRALCQVADRRQHLPELVREVASFFREHSLGCARVEHAREQRLRHRVVQVAGDAAPFLEAAFRLTPLGLGELCGRAPQPAVEGHEAQFGESQEHLNGPTRELRLPRSS